MSAIYVVENRDASVTCKIYELQATGFKYLILYIIIVLRMLISI
jgi:hypothetical protein